MTSFADQFLLVERFKKRLETTLTGLRYLGILCMSIVKWFAPSVTGPVVTFPAGNFGWDGCRSSDSVFAASVYTSLGQFRTDIGTASDYDFVLRLFRKIKKASVSYIPHVLVKMRAGGASNRSWKSYARSYVSDYFHGSEILDFVIPCFPYSKWLERFRSILIRKH